MTTKNILEISSYEKIIHLLKLENAFAPYEWGYYRSELERNIRAECNDVWSEIVGATLDKNDWKASFFRMHPEDLQEQFLDMKLGDVENQIFRDFSFYINKMQRLKQLQEYLRELKQLN